MMVIFNSSIYLAPMGAQGMLMSVRKQSELSESTLGTQEALKRVLYCIVIFIPFSKLTGNRSNIEHSSSGIDRFRLVVVVDKGFVGVEDKD